MNLDFKIDRDKGLELFGKFIRTKNIENLQGEQQRAGAAPYSAGSKQKLQVKHSFQLVFPM